MCIITANFTGKILRAALGVATILAPARSGDESPAHVPLGAPKTGEFSIGHLVASKTEVEALLIRAKAAGATVLDEPHDRPWGICSEYFRDPDGHLWEVIWNQRGS